MKIFVDKLKKLRRWYLNISILKMYFSIDKKITLATSNGPNLDKQSVLSRII